MSGTAEELLPTLPLDAWLVLGLVQLRPRSERDLEQDAATLSVFFPALPPIDVAERLDGLAADALVEQAEAGPVVVCPAAWRATPAGMAALRGWLAIMPEPSAHRDETLLKLLFADLRLDEALNLVRAHRADLRTLQRRLLTATPDGSWTGGRTGSARGLTTGWLLRDYGLAQVEAGLLWCERAEAALFAIAQPGGETPLPQPRGAEPSRLPAHARAPR